MEAVNKERSYGNKELLKRFIPYYKNHRMVLIFDLCCAALTTVCELILPMIMRYITNEGIQDLANLTIKTMGTLAGLYLVLRIIDCAASYYMTNMGHVMGKKKGTDMQRDA